MKKRVWIIIFFMLCLTTLFIIKTYALLETNAGGSQEMAIGKWIININNTNVTFSENVGLDAFVYDENIHVRNGYIAPGNGGKFLIDLDASYTDVSMKCTIEMDDSDLTEHENISVALFNATRTNLLNSNKDYSAIIHHDDTIRNFQVWYQLDWENDATYDEEDTKLIGKELTINFNVRCEQFLGE